VRRAAVASATLGGGGPMRLEGLGGGMDGYARSLLDRLDRLDRAGPAFPAPEPPLELSYTAVQSYLDCPACYYVRHVLHLETPTEAPMVTGRVVHRALAWFAERWRSAEAEGAAAPATEALLGAGRRIYFATIGPDASADPHALDQIAALLTAYAREFHDPGDQVLEVERFTKAPYVHAGVSHELQARFDRLDQTADGFRLVDFKTGRPTKRFTSPAADDLQLGIYAIALRSLMGEEVLERGTAEYWLLQSGERGVVRFEDLRFDKVEAAINGMIEGVLAGRFDPGRGCKGECAGLTGGLAAAGV